MEQGFSLNYWTEIKHRTRWLLENTSQSDCSFLVGDDEVLFKTHKMLLASSSPVFEAMFFGNLAEGPGPVRVPDLKPEGFKGMLEYIYSDDVVIPRKYDARLGIPFLIATSPHAGLHGNAVKDMIDSAADSFEFLFAVYLAARKYLLQNLQIACSNYLKRNTTPNNVFYIHQFAKHADVTDLVDHCCKTMQTKTLDILKSPSFLELNMDEVAWFFSMDTLNITSEFELFEAAERYATAMSEREDNTNTTKDERPTTKDSAVIPSALIRQIRFLAIPAREIAEYQTTSPVLTQSVMFALIMNVTSEYTYMPMPESFSKSRICRIGLIRDEESSLRYHSIDMAKDLARTEASFITVINNITNLKEYCSVPFQALGSNWRVASQLNNTGKAKTLNLIITLLSDMYRWREKVEFKLEIFSHKTAGISHHSDYANYQKKLEWTKLVDPDNGFVKHDSMTLEVHLRGRRNTR